MRCSQDQRGAFLRFLEQTPEHECAGRAPAELQECFDEHAGRAATRQLEDCGERYLATVTVDFVAALECAGIPSR